MRRLSGSDSAFLAGETPSWHMHVCSLMIVDPSTTPGGFDVDRLKESLTERLPLIPQFRWRLVEVPFELDRPGWIEDGDFDIDYHVRRIAVPAPGGSAELNRLVGDLAGYQLDRSRPLWELWVIEGVDGGENVATFTKIHHSIIDGASGMGLAEVLLDLEPDPPPREIDATPHISDEPPSQVELLARGAVNFALTPIRVGRLATQLVRQGLEVARFGTLGKPIPPLGLTTPKTPLNGDIGPHRSFASASVPLADVKEIKDRLGVKVNDVVLALCSTALRNYLLELGELPDQPLIAQCPVSLRSDGDGEVGSKVGNMMASLATDLDDPVQRLMAIHSSTQTAKEMRNAMSAHRIMALSDAAPPRWINLASRMVAATQLDRFAPPPMNVIISNVPGPPFELYMAGARLTALFPLGPLLLGNRLEITVISFSGSLDFGFMADRDNAPDPQIFADLLPDAMTELKKAVDELPK